MKKAVIFDLDGTLSDSIMSMKYSGDKTMAEFGYGPFSVQDYKYFVGDGAANLVKRALIKGGDTELTHFEAAYARYREIFQANCMYQVKPYEGIPKLLEELKKRGMKIAVLSNKPHHATLDVIESLFGKDYFDVVQGQVDGVPIKPDPAGVFRILDRFGLTADEVLYMGDTATDMKTGKYAEMEIVEDDLLEDETTQMAFSVADAKYKNIKVGDVIDIEVTPKNFGRIAAQKAKQVVVQKIREEERKVLYVQYLEKEREVITGIVQRYSGRNVCINLGKVDAILMESEQVPGERFRPTEHIKLYVVEVKDTPKGPRITVSRTHPEFVKIFSVYKQRK